MSVTVYVTLFVVQRKNSRAAYIISLKLIEILSNARTSIVFAQNKELPDEMWQIASNIAHLILMCETILL